MFRISILFKSIVLLVAFVSILISQSYATNIYVSMVGSDESDGTIDYPYGTIQKGLDNTFAGDTLFIRGGAYYIKDNLFVRNSGEPKKWVTIRNYPGEEVGINANKVASNIEEARKDWIIFGSLHISGVHYIKIQGLNILFSHAGGIMVRGKKGKYGEKPTTNIEITQCKVFSSYNSGIGIWYADSVKVTHCEIKDANNQRNRPKGYPIRREAPHEALSVPGTSNFEIAYNYLHLNQKEGIDIKEFSSNGKVHHNYVHNIMRQGIYVDSWFGKLHDIEVYNNIIHDCDWGIAISAEGKGSEMENVSIHDNLVYANTGLGIGFMTFGHDELRTNTFIYNNTICYNGMPGHWLGKTGGLGVMSKNIDGMFIYNNVFYKNYGYQIGLFANENVKEGKELIKSKNIVIENNLIDAKYFDTDTETGYFKVEMFPVYAKSTIVDMPQFINEKVFDFRLSPSYKVKSISKGFNEYENVGAELGDFYDLPQQLLSKSLVAPK